MQYVLLGYIFICWNVQDLVTDKNKSLQLFTDNFQAFSEDLMDSKRVENISSEDKHLSCTYGSRQEAQTISERILLAFRFPSLATNFNTIFDTNEYRNILHRKARFNTNILF